VYYLGSGQVSVSLLILNAGGRIETKAATGNRYIGGLDFENEVLRLCVAKIKKDFGKDVATDALIMSKLKRECENV